MPTAAIAIIACALMSLIAGGTSVLGLLNRLEDERQQRGEIPPGSDEELGSNEQPTG